MTLPDFNLWLAHPRTAMDQAQNDGTMVVVLAVIGALVYWRSKNPLVRVAICTLAGGWLMYLGYERIMPYFFK